MIFDLYILSLNMYRCIIFHHHCIYLKFKDEKKAFHLYKTGFVDVISESTDNDVITTILTELSNHNKR